MLKAIFLCECRKTFWIKEIQRQFNLMVDYRFKNPEFHIFDKEDLHRHHLPLAGYYNTIASGEIKVIECVDFMIKEPGFTELNEEERLRFLKYFYL